MTREEALYCIKARIEHYELYYNSQSLVKALKMAIKALEQEPQTEWIPVEEKLPDPDVEVLVTDDAGGLATISTDSIYISVVTGEKEWYTSQNVTAWMPLPPSYQGGK